MSTSAICAGILVDLYYTYSLIEEVSMKPGAFQSVSVLIVSTIVAWMTPSALADDISLFVVTGQSNARTQFAIGIEAGLRASGEFERVEIYHKRHAGNWLNTWIESNGGTYSPSTNMLTDLWAPDGTSELQQLIASFESEGHTVTIEGFFWFQGESDTLNAGSRSTYQSRFTWMINTLQDHYGAFDILITLVDWNQDLTELLISYGYTPEGVEELRDALRDSATELGGMYHDSRDYPRVDVWHIGVTNDSRGTYAAVTDLGADQVRTFLDHTACQADLNNDGELNFFDISLYIQMFQNACP